jgi:hypothetical protein
LRTRVLLVLLAGAGCGGDSEPPSAGSPAPSGLRVVGVEPAAQSRSAPPAAAITVRFDRAVQAPSVTARTFSAFGRWSGPAPGDFRVSEGGRAVTLVPRRPFQSGEAVTVSLAGVRGEDASPLSVGYEFRFWTRAAPTSMTLDAVATLSTRFPGGPGTRVYGGVASDLNRDGFPDLVTVNEDSADVRVFLNRGDRSGLFDDFLAPSVVGPRASPSEAADFDRDGLIDVAVASIDGNTVAILLGRGDGTFSPAQSVAVGRAPRGLAVLDADGDGDADIVNTNAQSSNLSLLRNDGEGRFGAPTFFDGGGDGEWALAAEDMTGDGLLDLVVGTRESREILVLAGRGDGTFAAVSRTPAGGGVWQLATGDLDGDAAADVATANGQSDNASILLGDGRGGLRLAQTLSVGRFSLASDLGDLDGDSDLDWIVSNFDRGWGILRNDGRGSFSVANARPAPAAGSCALALDSDGDGDLDIALIDELADVIVLLRNR